ncbi:MAG: LysR family transcriptional regulator [Lachnospiraceae bacterium]|nr:LysR family transcriptional regulator [Lachnospiraceae bacterium]
MTRKHIHIFLTVCECKNNISRAAQKLYMTQPAVSVGIQELERYYGITLFDRISRRLYLTEAGKEFQSYALRISALFDDMERGLRNWDSFGVLRAGASMTIGSQFMPGYIEAFSNAHPNVTTQVLIAPSRQLEQKLITNELDLALVEIPVHENHLTAEPYMEDYLEIIGPAKSPFQDHPVMPLDEFQKQKFLLRESGSGTRDIFEQVTQNAGLHIHPIWESFSTTALLNAVVHGAGITVLPRHLISAPLRQGLICRIQVPELTFRQQFYIVHHQDKFLSHLIQDFIQICKNYESEHPQPEDTGIF